jgi:hypothetical protein
MGKGGKVPPFTVFYWIVKTRFSVIILTAWRNGFGSGMIPRLRKIANERPRVNNLIRLSSNQ